ncbi:Na+/H+ antiporter NhaA [Dactylosporangium salmoneum]|uniref:Na(+)/H(+) antiporter NhaA n=1 Tax=Dactylosporangium salmoneum TaxID=53361 RepID=A0ABP5TPL0_9ACTN
MTGNGRGARLGARVGAALRRDVVGGVLLLAATAAALVWANSPWSASYETLRTTTVGPAGWHLRLTLQAWAADGLLAVFFFLVGNELKQELVHGELRHPRRALLPVAAALAGVVVPALVFAVVNLGRGEAAAGWGIPMATDVAFAVAILAMVGRGLPPALRTFLLTLAIVDDLAAIIVIAVFYAAAISWPALMAAVGLLAVFGLLQTPRGARVLRRLRVPGWALGVPLAVAIWTLTHHSGVHATIAGAAMGLLMRTQREPGEPADPSHRAEHLLRPVTTALVLPVFALTAAGVTFGAAGNPFTTTVTIGVILGLAAGKVIGIAGGAWLTARLSPAELNPALGWWDIVGMAQLAGIGFTVSLLMAELSYPDSEQLLGDAKSGVLAGSAIATLLAAIVLAVRARHRRRTAT